VQSQVESLGKEIFETVWERHCEEILDAESLTSSPYVVQLPNHGRLTAAEQFSRTYRKQGRQVDVLCRTNRLDVTEDHLEFVYVWSYELHIGETNVVENQQRTAAIERGTVEDLRTWWQATKRVL
jgi:hypothetical protein